MLFQYHPARGRSENIVVNKQYFGGVRQVFFHWGPNEGNNNVTKSQCLRIHMKEGGIFFLTFEGDTPETCPLSQWVPLTLFWLFGGSAPLRYLPQHGLKIACIAAEFKNMTPNQFEDSRVGEGTLHRGADDGDGSFEPWLTYEDSSPADQNQGQLRLMAASALPGDPVRNTAGEELGAIEEIMLDPESGRIAYAVLSFGGFLGIGEKLFAVPWSALTIDRDEHTYLLDIDQKVLDNAPGFEADNWPDRADPIFATEVHKSDGKTAHWDRRVTDAGDFAGAEHSPDRGESSSIYAGGIRH
jgi:sporulation protein YlmC with PRC-barrel domain